MGYGIFALQYLDITVFKQCESKYKINKKNMTPNKFI